MDKWRIDTYRDGRGVTVKAVHLQSGCVGLGDTKEEAMKVALDVRDSILTVNPTAQMEVDLDQSEIVDFGPFLAVKLWAEPEGEIEFGIWCDECNLSSACSLTMSIGSGMRVFQRMEVTQCLRCERITRKDLE